MVSTEMFGFVPFKRPGLGLRWLRQHLSCCIKPVTFPGPRDKRLERQGEYTLFHTVFQKSYFTLSCESHIYFDIQDMFEHLSCSPAAMCSPGGNLPKGGNGILPWD